MLFRTGPVGLIIAALVLLVAVAGAQPTLTLADFPMEPGVVVTSQMGPNEMAAGEPGTGLSWDFSGQATAIPSTVTWAEPTDQVGYDSFPDANRVSINEIMPGYQQLMYIQLLDDQPYLLGSVFVMPDDMVISHAITSGPTMPMPCSYGDEWDFVMDTEAGDETHHDSTHYVIDAWGTMTTAAGTFDVLRARADITNVDEEDISEFTIHYYWYAPDYGTVCATYAGNNDPDPQYDDGTYVYTSSIENWSDVPEFSPAVATEFSLLPVYPNPFNPTATVPFTLDRPAQVRLVLVNTLGQQVAVLTDAAFAPGQHMVPLNASTLAAGSYLVRLDINGQLVQSQRVTVLK